MENRIILVLSFILSHILLSESKTITPMAIFPGTKWCGAGNTATEESSLGIYQVRSHYSFQLSWIKIEFKNFECTFRALTAAAGRTINARCESDDFKWISAFSITDRIRFYIADVTKRLGKCNKKDRKLRKQWLLENNGSLLYALPN